jgi:serpin B
MQKAMMAVQENGVEAAAATSVLMSGSLAPTNVVTLNVNRPFVIAIIDDPTGTILFLGHIADPTVAGSP